MAEWPLGQQREEQGDLFMFSPLPPFLLPLSLPLAQAEHWLGSSESLPRPDAATEGQADGGGGWRIRCHHCHAGHVTVARQCRRLRLGQAATDAAAAGTVTVHWHLLRPPPLSASGFCGLAFPTQW